VVAVRSAEDYGLTDEELMEEALREDDGPLAWFWHEADDLPGEDGRTADRGTTTVTMTEGYGPPGWPVRLSSC
jgi:hypothetical protein